MRHMTFGFDDSEEEKEKAKIPCRKRLIASQQDCFLFRSWVFRAMEKKNSFRRIGFQKLAHVFFEVVS